MNPIVSVVGKSHVGKTTFLEDLVRELKSRDYRVAVIKHDTHGFEIDQPGKDTWRLAQAGSDAVMISSADKMALIRKVAEELSLDQLAWQLIGEVDIVLTEGYKRADKPKIEVSRAEVSKELLCTEDELLAIVSDQRFDLDVPQFGLENAAAVADLLAEKLMQREEVAVGLVVNGNPIPLNFFVRKIFTSTLLGMLSSLRGTDDPQDIKLSIKLP